MSPPPSAATVLVMTAETLAATTEAWATVTPSSVGSEPTSVATTADAWVTTFWNTKVPVSSRALPASEIAEVIVARAPGMSPIRASPAAVHTAWVNVSPAKNTALPVTLM